MKRNLAKLSALTLAATAVFGFAGCTTTERTKEGYDNLKVYFQSGASYVSATPDPVWAAIEEKTKTVLSYSGAPSDYITALSALLNDLNDKDRPDIFWVKPDLTNGAYYKWAGEFDFIEDMDALIAANPGAFPHIEALFASQKYNALEWNGAHRMVPWLTTDNIYSIYYRTDWLKNVGEVDENGNAKIPVTLNDLERVLYKFRNNDPDGNGRKDTWGVSMHSQSFSWNQLYHAFGVCETWDYDENGNVVYMGTQPEMKEFLKWANKLYELDLIEPQFNTNTGVEDREKFKNGITGILFTDAEQHVKWIMNDFETKQGVGLVEMGAPLVGTGETGEYTGCELGAAGKQGSSTRGAWWGGFSITTSCKNKVAAMRYLDFLISPEGSMLNTYGVEGEHYSLAEDGTVTISAEQMKNRRTSKAFATSQNDDGIQESNGRYLIGSNMEGGVIEIKDGQVTVSCQANVIDYHNAKLVQQAADRNVPFFDKIPEGIIYPAIIADNLTAIEDIRESKFNLFVMGRYKDIGGANFDSAWEAYVESINKKNLSALKTAVKETAQSYGYTG